MLQDVTISKMRHFYVHIPFCRKKCNYCGFYSVPYYAKVCNRLIETILREIEDYKFQINEHDNDPATFFIGGGTPSIIPAEYIGLIAKHIARKFNVEEFAEFTVEGNPESLTREFLKNICSIGVNRISIGIQSLDDACLKFLGRIHTAEQALDCIDNAIRTGFTNVNVDIIYGVPGFKKDITLGTVAQIIDKGIAHISLYSLTIEPNTTFHKLVENGSLKMLSGDEVANQYYCISDFLCSNGYLSYEVSNFALPGRECVHNLSYWQRKPYLGFGPSAHSFDGKRRWANIPSISLYIELIELGKNPLAFIDELAPIHHFEEIVMLGLRLQNGFYVEDANALLPCGHKVQKLRLVEEMLSYGIMQMRDGNLALSKKHRLLADGVATRITHEVQDAFLSVA